jgi:hypothetical protein
MGLNRRFINYQETLTALKSDTLSEYYGMTELFYFQDELSQYVYDLHSKGKSSRQILRWLKLKKVLLKIEWWFDYYIAWFLYNPNKRHRYFEYMTKKWKDKF